MFERFLASTDAAQVLELMREADLSALQLTDALGVGDDGARYAVVMLLSPARLVLRRLQGDVESEVVPTAAPPALLSRLAVELGCETLWRRVRKQLDERFS